MNSMQLSRQIRDAGREVAACPGTSLADVLNDVLNRFLGWPFRAATAAAIDPEGLRTATFGTVVHAKSTPDSERASEDVLADTLAAVIDVSESLDLEQLRVAYQRIVQAKSLKKSPAARMSGTPYTTRTLGIIFARSSSVPFEKLTEEIDRLNRQTPSSEWPDMIAVLSTGIINYVIQFPGGPLSGDYLPPAEGALTAYVPPVYVVLVMKPAGVHTFNRLVSFLFAHLAIFSPGASPSGDTQKRPLRDT